MYTKYIILFIKDIFKFIKVVFMPYKKGPYILKAFNGYCKKNKFINKIQVRYFYINNKSAFKNNDFIYYFY